MMILFVVIRLVYTNYAAMVASLMPIALTFAVSTPYNPVWLGMLCLVASSIAFMVPFLYWPSVGLPIYTR